MLSNYLLIILISIFMGVILTHPATAVTGAASGLFSWFQSVIPSLFPFMVLTGLLINSGALPMLSASINRIPIVRKLPVTAIFAVITGLLCGYPMGIRTVSELKSTGQLTLKQARILYCFVNQPGPMFVLGYALPLTGLAVDEQARFLLAFYGGVTLTGLTAVLWAEARELFKGFSRFPGQQANTQQPSSDSPLSQTKHFLVTFESTLLSSMVTLGKIGGYMILFSMAAALIQQLIPDQPLICLTFSGILEMTSGLAQINPSPYALADTAPTAVLAFISFGGLSVAAQSFSLGNLTVREQLSYLLWKLIQAMFTVWLFLQIGM